MKSLYGIKAWFYLPLLIIFLMSTPSTFAVEVSYFDCGTAPDSIGDYVENPAIHREAVAVYACKSSRDSTLPSWWQTIWGLNNRPGVYTYFKDNSRNRYSVSAHPYGQNSTYAYTSIWDPGTGDSPDLTFISDILYKLDVDIDFSQLDDDTNGIVDALFFFVVNDTNTVPDGHYFGGEGMLYTSNDQNYYNEYVRVDGSRTVWIRAQSDEAATAVAAHELGHVLGLPEAAKVELKVYNLLGQEVRTLVDYEQPAGIHQIVWDGTDASGNGVASGLYFYKLKTPTFAETKQMMFVK